MTEGGAVMNLIFISKEFSKNKNQKMCFLNADNSNSLNFHTYRNYLNKNKTFSGDVGKNKLTGIPLNYFKYLKYLNYFYNRIGYILQNNHFSLFLLTRQSIYNIFENKRGYLL